MTSILARMFNNLADLLPEWPRFGLGQRVSSPISGTCYRVRSRVNVPAVLLPLNLPLRRFEISLAPTTLIRIATPTRADESHVYAHLEMANPASVIPASEREAALTTGYLLEVPRRILRSHFAIA